VAELVVIKILPCSEYPATPPTYEIPPVAAALLTAEPPEPPVFVPLVILPPLPPVPPAPPVPPVPVTLPATPTFVIIPVLYPVIPPT
jgi:hypothetical protein